VDYSSLSADTNTVVGLTLSTACNSIANILQRCLHCRTVRRVCLQGCQHTAQVPCPRHEDASTAHTAQVPSDFSAVDASSSTFEASSPLYQLIQLHRQSDSTTKSLSAATTPQEATHATSMHEDERRENGSTPMTASLDELSQILQRLSEPADLLRKRQSKSYTSSRGCTLESTYWPTCRPSAWRSRST
jgi:hypothetical protein